jgi:hypothetical protein
VKNKMKKKNMNNSNKLSKMYLIYLEI